MKTIRRMKKRIQIVSQKEVFKQHIFRIEEAHLRHQRYDGTMSAELVRLSFERGDSAAVVVHDAESDQVVLIEQFRYSTVADGPGWILELPAGKIEASEKGDPQVTMRREIMEEIGYDIAALRKIASFYVSPGGTSERIFLYYAAAKPTDQKAKGGGLASEGEDIRILTLSVDEALKKVASGAIMDAKTIIGLQWLQLQRGKNESR